jgi:hypothetical protein
MCYGENGTVKFLETLADNIFRHDYSMMQIYIDIIAPNFTNFYHQIFKIFKIMFFTDGTQKK